MAWTKSDEPSKVDIEGLKEAYILGWKIIDEAVGNAKQKKKERDQKIEDIRVNVFGLKPSKKYGGK